MIGTDPAPHGRSIARTLRIALLGLTIVLAIIGAVGIAALYDARQQYEDQLSEASSLEVASANLLAATVALEANLTRPRSRTSAGFVARAAGGLQRTAALVSRLAAKDGPSTNLAAPIAPALRDARALAAHPTDGATRARARGDLGAVRRAVALLAERQRGRRQAARDRAASRSRTAIMAIGVSAGLALIGVLAFLTLLIRTMHRPLDDLVTATRRMASGDLNVRVRAAGPTELEALGTAFNTMGRDLAEASARVETQRQRLATTMESLGDGLVIVDPNERVTTMNPRARELAGGLQPGGAAYGPHSPLPRLHEALAGEVTVQHSGGALAITAARLAGPDGGVVWTLRDITERARLEQAKSDFVATASHELRSPLTSIKGFIELLESTNSENLTPRQLEFIGIVLQSTDRLVDLVNDLLDIARIESGQFEIHARSVDLRSTVEEVAALMQPRLLAKRQHLDLDIAEPRPPALADPSRVRQIVTNLVTNAHLYTGEGGTITLRLQGDRDATRITVSDSGRGMSAEDLRRVFDRFYRGASDERKSPGTGLGLAIVKSLVDMHGGSIDVASEPGRGTAFTISLPPAPAFGAAAAAAAAAVPALGRRRVLVVDDEPALAALVAQQLQPLGVETVPVHSGAEALERLRAGEHFDAMTLDVLMPGLNGLDVLRSVRADPRLADLPVVFVSVSSTLPALEGEWSVGKPIDLRHLTDVLEAALQAKRSRALVLAPERVRDEVAAALASLGIEYRWVTSTEDAARAGSQELFEVALIHSSLSNAPAVLQGTALRGRRRGRSVILFSTDGEWQTHGPAVGMPVFPLPQAVSALRSALGDTGSTQGR
ncbi:MAG TPA: ATP-binding protein [Solirubrobacteraceae bacterium]|nr:ATP-binding protein [Solirubrobacteraceae bacterium]